MKPIKFSIILVLFLVLGSNINADESKLPVFVSILPQKYFVQQIGKDLVSINVMVAPGANPATYEPKPKQMATITRAKLYFSIGVPFEKTWLDKISAANPKMAIVHTDQDIPKIEINFAAKKINAHNGHNDAHGHDHHGLDPHIWLSPPLVKIQCKTILNALVSADPENERTYQSNYLDFINTIELLDADLKQMFQNANKLRFLVFHPSWGYFAHAYGMEQLAIEIEGKEPKPGQLMEIIRIAKQDNITAIFVQPQFSTRNAQLIAKEIQGELILADPLAENWLSNLKTVAQKFKEASK